MHNQAGEQRSLDPLRHRRCEQSVVRDSGFRVQPHEVMKNRRAKSDTEPSSNRGTRNGGKLFGKTELSEGPKHYNRDGSARARGGNGKGGSFGTEHKGAWLDQLTDMRGDTCNSEVVPQNVRGDTVSQRLQGASVLANFASNLSPLMVVGSRTEVNT
jgi:hypothetical protein